MNSGIFTGNIGRDAEVRQTTSGDKVTNFSIGVNVGTKSEPDTMWVDCQMWKERGEKLAPYLLKGTKVTVIGRVTLRKFVKQDGTHDASLQVSINDIDMHGRRENGGEQAEYERHDTPKQRQVAATQQKRGDLDDEIPF